MLPSWASSSGRLSGRGARRNEQGPSWGYHRGRQLSQVTRHRARWRAHLVEGGSPTMPRDPDEKPAPPAEATSGFDPNTLPRWRSKRFPAPDDPPEEPAPQKPVPAPARETTPEVATPEPEGAAVLDLDRLPRVRPVFMLTPDDPPAKPAPQKPAPAPTRETAPEFDTDNLPLLRSQFRLTPDDLAGKRAPSEPAPGGPKEDWGRLAGGHARPTRERTPTPGRRADRREPGRTSRVPRGRRG